MSNPATPCPDDMQPASPGLLTFDYATAEREGWTIGQTDPYLDGQPCVTLHMLTTPAAQTMGFQSVQDVYRHVVQQAKAGSVLLKEALSLLDARERFVVSTLYEC